MEHILSLNNTISKKIVNNNNCKKIPYFSSIYYTKMYNYNKMRNVEGKK